MKKTLGVQFVLGALAAMCGAPSSAADAEAHRDAFTLEGREGQTPLVVRQDKLGRTY
jgi:hypothetical protein